MAPRSKITRLPQGLKQWLDKALLEGDFECYQALSDALKAHGYDISKSAVHRYGQRFEERLRALKTATEQARAVVDASPDDEDALNQALVRLTQQKLFDVLINLQVDPAKVNLSGATRSIAELARASIHVKDYSAKVKARLQEAAQATQAQLQRRGLEADAIQQITARILGVAK